MLPSGRRCFPVVEDDQVLGLLTLHRIKQVPRARWRTTLLMEDGRLLGMVARDSVLGFLRRRAELGISGWRPFRAS